MHPDQELIARCRQNDAQAFRDLLTAYQPLVFRVSFRLLCDEEEAKDVVQETFVRVWLQLHRYKSSFKFSTWLYKIASNLCYDRLRARQRRQKRNQIQASMQSPLSDENIEQSLINKELKAHILRLTRGLPPKQRLVFTLRDIENLEIDELTHVTGLSPDKIKRNLYIARQHIRTQLQQISS